MKKHCIDMKVVCADRLNNAYGLLRLTPASGSPMPEGILPGQFVQIDVPGSKTTYLRRPISVNFVDYDANELWLLVRNAGAGTATLIASQQGCTYNVILPLGNGFTMPALGAKVLLAGGGVGVAPLLYFGKKLNDAGIKPTFALGARSQADLLMLDQFARYGHVCVATEDGSAGIRGFVTQLPEFEGDIDHIACCGPTPMMRAVAAIAKRRGIHCEVSLENMMACGLGACLCCVEDTADKGNVCVCKEGPVFNIDRLKWNI